MNRKDTFREKFTVVLSGILLILYATGVVMAIILLWVRPDRPSIIEALRLAAAALTPLALEAYRHLKSRADKSRNERKEQGQKKAQNNGS